MSYPLISTTLFRANLKGRSLRLISMRERKKKMKEHEFKNMKNISSYNLHKAPNFLW